MTTKKVWFVTGASKGLGLVLTKKLLDNGYAVAATSRDLTSLKENIDITNEAFMPLEMNLSDESGIRHCVEKTISQFGKIDALVSNAGYGQTGTIEELSNKETRDNFEVNVFGLLNVVRAILPLMRKQRSGHIFNISSIAGIVGGFSGFGIYCSTKFAVSGITEALYADLKDLGIKTTLVYPGYFRTNFLSKGSIKLPASPIEEYKVARNLISEHVNTIDQNQTGDPEKASAVLIKVFNMQAPPLHLPLGTDALTIAQEKIKTFSDEIQKWQHISTSTDFEKTVSNAI